MPFAPRPTYDWRLRTRSLALGRRTLIIGILNVTPDSFSDGGHFYDAASAPERAVAHALDLLDHGADLLDLGGESTRPGATRLSPDEEQARVLPVLEALLRERPRTIVSIDTFHAATAQRAVEVGAEIVNDVSGGLWDPAMLATLASLGCGVILMHTRGTPNEWRTQTALAPNEVMPLVLSGLEDRLAASQAAGISPEKIVLDPGLGFGKRLDENYPILAHLSELHRLERPILFGASRKSFLAQTVAQSPSLAAVHQAAPPPVNARLNATTAANVAAILAGAHILRVHEAQPAAEAAAIADRILQGFE
ncbi:dihydropteroate synthase [Edaphobacter aggregans]|uniref:dihydropteroate synthase n=1 Tax=Edaphobacter aggregans TaxID=570835 RepID=UPI0005585916|nr:dihydropteroate synthase [Edaphobacter aggregans]